METPITDAKQAQSINYIRDEPVDADQFGTHSRVARAMAETIASHRDLEVIGLLGPWGSGKSTVIKFLDDLLEAESPNESIFCFAYDAWLHQSDPPRRSFLESLIRFLIAKKLTSEERWSERLAQLNRQIEETDVQTTPTLSRTGRWLIPLALLVPFGLQFMAKDWLDAMTAPRASLFERLAFPVGALLAVLPAIAGLVLWYSWRPVRQPWKEGYFSRENFTKNRAPYEKESLLSLFTNREVVYQKNRTIKSPDPTTIEFQTTFREILSEIKQYASGKPVRLIFVIDNLDRVPESQAVEMWATVRSFFLGAHTGIRLPMVILPIDESSVERMFAVSHGNQEAGRLAQSFKDKTFDLTFRVTPPVLSNWQRYIRTQLKYMFGEEYREDWDFIVSSFFDYREQQHKPDEPITPRQINILLNEIGTLYAQWRSENLTFASVVYYSVFRKRIDENIFRAVNQPEAGVDDQDAEWALAIAAMHYGVPRDEAAQVLLERRVREAIANAKLEEFLKLAQTPGFPQVLEQVVADPDGAGYPVNRAIWLVDRLPETDSAWIYSAWKRLRAKQLEKDSKSFSNDDLGALRAVIRHCPESSRGAFLGDEAAMLASLEAVAFSKSTALDAIIEALSFVLESFEKDGLEVPEIKLKADARVFLKILASFPASSGRRKALLTTSSDDQLVDAIAAAYSDPQSQPIPIGNIIRALIETRPGLGFSKLVEAAGAKLSAALDSGTALAAMTLSVLAREGVDATQERIDSLVDQLVARFDEAYAGNEFGALGAVAVAILISARPDAVRTPDGVTWLAASKGRKQLVPSIANAAWEAEINELETYVDLAEGYAQIKPLLTLIVSELLRSGRLVQMNPSAVAANYDRIWNIVPSEDDITIVNIAAADDVFWKTLEDAPLEKITTIADLLIDEKSEYRDRGAKMVQRKLESAAAETWATAVGAADDSVFALAAALSNASGNKPLGGSLADGLRKTFDLLKADDNAVRGRWFELLQKLSKPSQKTVLRSLRDWLAGLVDVESPLSLLTLADGLLVREGELDKRADDLARNVILPLLASDPGFVWLSQSGSRISDVVAGSSPETRASIRERLQDAALDAENEARRNWAEGLRAAWNFQPFAEPERGEGDGGPLKEEA